MTGHESTLMTRAKSMTMTGHKSMRMTSAQCEAMMSSMSMTKTSHNAGEHVHNGRSERD